MKKVRFLYTVLFLTILSATGCNNMEVANSAADKSVPENIVLGDFKPVVVLAVSVVDDVWNVEAASVQFGTPTESIVLDRDLLVEVLDLEGTVLYQCSKHDPRVIYEEEPPKYSNIIRMKEGKFYIATTYNPAIYKITLTGQTPRLTRLRKSFDITDSVKEAYQRFEKQRG